MRRIYLFNSSVFINVFGATGDRKSVDPDETEYDQSWLKLV